MPVPGGEGYHPPNPVQHNMQCIIVSSMSRSMIQCARLTQPLLHKIWKPLFLLKNTTIISVALWSNDIVLYLSNKIVTILSKDSRNLAAPQNLATSLLHGPSSTSKSRNLSLKRTFLRGASQMHLLENRTEQNSEHNFALLMSCHVT